MAELAKPTPTMLIAPPTSRERLENLAALMRGVALQNRPRDQIVAFRIEFSGIVGMAKALEDAIRCMKEAGL